MTRVVVTATIKNDLSVDDDVLAKLAAAAVEHVQKVVDAEVARTEPYSEIGVGLVKRNNVPGLLERDRFALSMMSWWDRHHGLRGCLGNCGARLSAYDLFIALIMSIGNAYNVWGYSVIIPDDDIVIAAIFEKAGVSMDTRLRVQRKGRW